MPPVVCRRCWLLTWVRCRSWSGGSAPASWRPASTASEPQPTGLARPAARWLPRHPHAPAHAGPGRFHGNATELAALAASGRSLLFDSICDAQVRGVRNSHTFLRALAPAPRVAELMQPTLDAMAAHAGPVVGLHMRQGAVIDYFEVLAGGAGMGAALSISGL